MSDRPTKEFTLPISGSKVVLKTWMSGGEWQEMQNELFAGMKINPMEPQTGQFDGLMMAKASEKALQLLVVSIDGVAEDCVKKLKEMHFKDYRFVVDEVNKITQDTGDKNEKKSEGK